MKQRRSEERLGDVRSRAIGVLVYAAAGCAEPSAPPALPDAADVALDLAGSGAVTGTIAGSTFTASQVRMRVVTRAGHERVDLLIADRPIERCGLPVAREHVLVWLRLRGRTNLEPGTTYARLDESAAPSLAAELGVPAAEHPSDADGANAILDVHYEGAGIDGRSAVHRGLARLEITRAEATAVEGRLRACFADDAHSCVGGHFIATPCLSRIDGRALREPPGLADEALEPFRGRTP